MLSNAKVSKDSMCRVADGVRPAVFVRAKKALRAGQEVSFKYIEKKKQAYLRIHLSLKHSLSKIPTEFNPSGDLGLWA